MKKHGGLPIGAALPYKGELPKQSVLANLVGRVKRPWVVVELTNPADATWFVAYQPPLFRLRPYRRGDWFWYRPAAKTQFGIDIARNGRVQFG